MKKTGACITAALVIVLCVITAGCQKRESSGVSIQVKGSDTEVNLVQRLAEAFMEKIPDASIAVTGGGSGTGIAALMNGQTDIANSSRAMKEEEIKRANDNDIDPVAVVFALDGLTLIAHQSFPLDSLNLRVTVKKTSCIIRNDS
jgi:phosphate transport system substrate-binding protein